MTRTAPDRNLSLDLLRVTEAAAMAGGRWVGRGDKNGADQVAVDAMRAMLATVSMAGIVVIGEGEKDAAPMLYNGEAVGDGTGPACDVAVDPIDGTRLTADGLAGAIAVIAAAPRGAMCDVSSVFYMDKLAAAGDVADVVDVCASAGDNIRAVARARGERPEDVTVCLLDRPRHAGLLHEVRAAGARVQLLAEGDVAGALMAVRPNIGVDLLLGVGGAPEGVITACAVKAMRGVLQGRLAPQDADERRRGLDAGLDLDRVYTADDLVAGDDVYFAATGITDGELMRGVRYGPGTAHTHSITVRGRSGTVRSVFAEHSLERLAAYSAVRYSTWPDQFEEEQ